MKLYRKDGDIIEIVAFPEEKVFKGDYLIIEDLNHNINLLVQVIDMSYIDSPGVLEELIREGLLKYSDVEIYENIEYNRATKLIRDTKILKCVIRGAINDGEVVRFINNLPSRVSSKVRKIPSSELMELASGKVNYPIIIGEDLMGKRIAIDASKLDGSLTLITGMKGSGKSHLAKLIASSFSKLSIPYIVLDINEEYLGLEEAGYATVLKPGENLFFDMEYLGRETVLDTMVNVLNLPGVSANLFNELWNIISRRGVKLTIDIFIEYVERFVKNMMVKDALISRLMILKSCRFIHKNGYTKLEDFFKDNIGYVITLRDLSSLERKILVEILLKKFSTLLEKNIIPPFFLFAEEAHMYIRDTFWEDIITRMRHFGLFIIFITNQPDSIDHLIFRQLDNIFMFRFLNDRDLESLSRVSNIDSNTVKSIVKDLRRGQVLIVGNVVDLFPVVASIKSLNFNVRGETKKILNYAKIR